MKRKKRCANRPMSDTTIHNADVKLNDNLIRLLGIPFFGIAIPNVSGLFENLPATDPRYWLGYVYFIALAYMIWQGNRYLLFRTRKRFTWFDKPIEKLISPSAFPDVIFFPVINLNRSSRFFKPYFDKIYSFNTGAPYPC